MTPLERARKGHNAMLARKSQKAALDLAALADASVKRAEAELAREQRAMLLDDARQRLAKLARAPAGLARRIAPRRVSPKPAQPVETDGLDDFLTAINRRLKN